jgi:hypothetical protein
MSGYSLFFFVAPAVLKLVTSRKLLTGGWRKQNLIISPKNFKDEPLSVGYKERYIQHLKKKQAKQRNPKTVPKKGEAAQHKTELSPINYDLEDSLIEKIEDMDNKLKSLYAQVSDEKINASDAVKVMSELQNEIAESFGLEEQNEEELEVSDYVDEVLDLFNEENYKPERLTSIR